jgi:1-aminocyclopropane-1-carboxylate deaminase/D-cysteine desulfhydrase-like pyridoxal-dependent ACC family enzyme
MIERRQFSGTQGDWNRLIAGLPGPQFLQTWEWGQIKAPYGWQPHPLVWVDGSGEAIGAALVLERTVAYPLVPVKFRIQYIPRGPLLRNWEDSSQRQQVIASISDFARERRSIFIKLDPELPLAYGIAGDEGEELYPPGQEFARELEETGWLFSNEQIQYRNTIHINLQGDEDSLLARMKQKTRYNIRLAERKGVTVRTAGLNDLPLLYKLYALTATRDGFVIRGEEYYLRVWRTFIEAGMAEALIAEVENTPVGGLVIFRFGDRAWYVYGMSRDEHRKKCQPTFSSGKPSAGPDLLAVLPTICGVRRINLSSQIPCGVFIASKPGWGEGSCAMSGHGITRVTRCFTVFTRRSSRLGWPFCAAAAVLKPAALPECNHGGKMNQLPCVKFAHLPTPVEPLTGLSAPLGGINLWIKRDDQTGLALGGNKTRKLEYLMAEAQANGARSVITTGAIQSNHCRQTAAAAARLGLDCVLVLTGSAPLHVEGNFLLDQLLGARIIYTERPNRDLVLQQEFEKLWAAGQRPYLVPYGGSSPTGAAAYAYALEELIEQGFQPDWIVFASSSGGTQAGLVAGARLLKFGGRVLGISIDEPEAVLKERVSALAGEVTDRLGSRQKFPPRRSW